MREARTDTSTTLILGHFVSVIRRPRAVTVLAFSLSSLLLSCSWSLSRRDVIHFLALVASLERSTCLPFGPGLFTSVPSSWLPFDASLSKTPSSGWWWKMFCLFLYISFHSPPKWRALTKQLRPRPTATERRWWRRHNLTPKWYTRHHFTINYVIFARARFVLKIANSWKTARALILDVGFKLMTTLDFMQNDFIHK